jgi:hypothetical protein
MRLSHCTKSLLLPVVLSFIVVLSSCAHAASPPPKPQADDISWLKGAGNVTVGFTALMTFDVTGDFSQQFTWPATLAVPAVPITWTGNVFNGAAEDKQEGSALTDTVHGSISPDGAWINEMTYSRSLSSQFSRVYFLVTLRDVPITRVAGAENDNATIVADFIKKGSDIRKHIAKIEYFTGGETTATYSSADWDDANGILNLNVEFAAGTGTREIAVAFGGC